MTLSLIRSGPHSSKLYESLNTSPRIAQQECMWLQHRHFRSNEVKMEALTCSHDGSFNFNTPLIRSFSAIIQLLIVVCIDSMLTFSWVYYNKCGVVRNCFWLQKKTAIRKTMLCDFDQLIACQWRRGGIVVGTRKKWYISNESIWR